MSLAGSPVCRVLAIESKRPPASHFMSHIYARTSPLSGKRQHNVRQVQGGQVWVSCCWHGACAPGPHACVAPRRRWVGGWVGGGGAGGRAGRSGGSTPSWKGSWCRPSSSRPAKNVSCMSDTSATISSSLPCITIGQRLVKGVWHKAATFAATPTGPHSGAARQVGRQGCWRSFRPGLFSLATCLFQHALVPLAQALVIQPFPAGTVGVQENVVLVLQHKRHLGAPIHRPDRGK